MDTETLLRQAQRGDAAALGEILAGVQQVCFGFALRLTRNSNEAEDLCQEAFLRVTRDIGACREPAAFRCWLLRLVYCTHLDRVKSDRARKDRERRDGAMREEREEAGPVERLEQKELVERLRQTLGELRESYRIALCLHYEQGLTYAEASEVLGASPNTVSTHIRRGLEELRERLGAQGFACAAPLMAQALQQVAPAQVPASLAAFVNGLAGAGAAKAMGAGAATGGTIAAGAGAKAAAMAGGTTLALKVAVATAVVAGTVVLWQAAQPPQVPSQPPAAVAAPADTSPRPLTLVVQGPFEDRKEMPFGKTDCPFVQPQSIELSDERKGRYLTSLRVRFRFLGPKDPGSGMCVAISHSNGDALDENAHRHGDVVEEQVWIGADRRFLTQMPLWANTKDDEWVGTAEFNLRMGIRDNLDQLQVTFSRVRLTEDSAQALTEAAWIQALASIAKLNDEDLERRESAARELAAMGEPLLPYLEMLSEAVGEHPGAPPNLRERLQPIEAAIRAKIAERDRTEMLAHLKEALKRGYGYEAPSPRTSRALKKQISVDFIDTPLSKAMESFSAMSGVTIVLDPEVSKGVSNVSLRATELFADSVLTWATKITDVGFAVRKNGVVVTTKDRARILNSEQRILSLPVEPGSDAWTEDELKRLCSVYKVTNCQLNGPNSAKVVGKHNAVERLVQTLPYFGKPQPLPAAGLPAWVTRIEKQLDAQVNLEAGMRMDHALEQIEQQVHVDLRLDSRDRRGEKAPDPSRPLTQPITGLSARDVLNELCRQSHAHIRYSNGYSEQRGLHISLYAEDRCALAILPLGEALKTAVPPDKLDACLRQVIWDAAAFDQVFAYAELDPLPMFVVRGRWFVEVDPWTLQRMVKVLDETIRSGRIPAVPTPPWFLDIDKTLASINEALADPDVTVRARAASALGRLRGEKVLAVIEKALADPDVKVCSEAAAALGHSDNWRALPIPQWALIEKALADTRADVRAVAATAASRVGGEKALALLEKPIDDPDAKVRMETARALGRFREEKALVLIEKALADPVADVRAVAVDAAGRVGGENALTLIGKTLADSDAKVRATAVSRLIWVSDKKATELIEKVLADPVADVRAAAATALGNIDGEAAKREMDYDDLVGAYVGGTKGSDEKVALLEKALTDPEVKVRAAVAGAAASLCRAGNGKALVLVEKAFGDQDASVRRAAIKWPYQMKDVPWEQVLPLFDRAFADADAGVRIEAAGSLGQLVGKQARGLLLKQLAAEKDAKVLRAVRDVLDIWFGRDPEVVKALKEAEARMHAPQPVPPPPPRVEEF